MLGTARKLYDRELRIDQRNRLTFPTRQEFEAEGRRVMAEMESGETAPNDIGRLADVLAMRDAAEMDREQRGLLISELRRHEIGRAHVSTPVTNAYLVCRLLLEKRNNKTTNTYHHRSTSTIPAPSQRSHPI